MTPKYLSWTSTGGDIPTEFSKHVSGPFAIPMACFIPERIDGFLAAEKNTRDSARERRNAPATEHHADGQAAGAIAAAVAEVRRASAAPGSGPRANAHCSTPGPSSTSRRSAMSPATAASGPRSNSRSSTHARARVGAVRARKAGQLRAVRLRS
jgi:hypothetical protein